MIQRQSIILVPLKLLHPHLFSLTVSSLGLFLVRYEALAMTCSRLRQEGVHMI